MENFNLFFSYLCTNMTEILKGLIECARLHSIEFIYAISPGIDIVYSEYQEVVTLKDKLKQVGVTLISSVIVCWRTPRI